ncbi:hypothetical protein PVAND_014465 [Polypedilum vanderplanki]|uniref:Integrase catalytic domain-containing protein n=1 Tax=Polypedilum vanderplanki TaxID=319348 RepID=A0A9J6B9R8_POLVA|nr:hypothetical protein PVAND_014465 [Polypedilum vanderplanki]
MTNLNTLSVNPEWIKQMNLKDPLIDSDQAYFLPGRVLKSEVKCQATICRWETRSAAGKTIKEKSQVMEGEVTTVPRCHPMALCFGCNRTYHLMCVDISLKSADSDKEWSSESLPWRCPECRLNPHNPTASAYYASNEWTDGLSSRRRSLFNSLAIANDKKLIEAKKSSKEYYKDDLEDWVDHEATTYVTVTEYQTQKAEWSKVMDEMSDVVAERDELLEKANERDQLKAKLAELESKLNDTSFMQPSFNAPSSTFYEPSKTISSKDILSSIYLKANNKKAPPQQPHINTSANPSQSFQNNQSGAGLTQPDRSCLNGVDLSKLNTSEKVILEQANAQRESTTAQRAISNAMLLEQQRKSLQKIATFNGDERDWIRFKRDVTRHKEIGQYDDNLMKMYVLKALEGVAADRVRDMIDIMPFSYTMKVLEETFGDPTRIINKRGEDILEFKLGKELYKEDVIILVTRIQAYFAACKHAGIEIANTNYLAKHIFDQLTCEQRQRCRRFHREEYGEDTNQLIDLATIYKFLESLMKDLDDKKAKPTQVNSTSFVAQSSNSRSSNPSFDHYEVKDINQAKHYGYDINLVKAIVKKCLNCNKNHYTVECRGYYVMDKNKRWNFIKEKGLCSNCIITTAHKASECNLKPSCGKFDNGSRCKGKHHVSLHNASGNRQGGFNRGRNNSNKNLNRANEIQSSFKSPAEERTNVETAIQSAPSISQANNSSQNGISKICNDIRNKRTDNSVTTATIMTPWSTNNMNSEQGNTVKVFKTKFYANDGKFITGYSVGDSASETTLMSENLRQALNLKGERCRINVRWADSTMKSIEAIRVDLDVSGVINNAEKIRLQECFAVSSDDFQLPPRSLNIKLLKKHFPYLKPVKCDSYENVVPQLLIGSHHAAIIESCGQLYEGGTGKPVGLKAKLGWCIYGGNPEIIQLYNISNIQFENNKSYNETSMSNDELFEAFSYFNSIENINLPKENENHLTEDETKALEIMEEEMKILSNGSIEVPLVWNRHEKVIPLIPNNFGMVLKRQEAHETKLLKNPEHHRIYNEKFKENLAENYIRPATMDDLNGNWPNINYLPMTLVINQNKVPVGYRIVFDAAAKFNGTSLNQNLLKGPDLLVNLHEPVLYMRTKEIAFTADIKAMFMRMKVNMRDQQCQRVIYRETPDEDWKIFIVSSVLFGPTCSPFQSQFCKNLLAKAWKDTYPEASEVIEKYMYMDDLLISESNVEKAVDIAKNCIEMFARINWNLISFQSNSIDFLKKLPLGSVKQETIPLMEDESQKCTAKVLGCVWDTKNDKFIFNFDKNLFIKIVKDCQHKPTKRDQSSTIARIFDIMGFLSHLVIRGRILLQRSWENGIDWDQQISDSEHQLWLDWLQEIEKASVIKIPRKLCKANDLWSTGEVELHCFCDAGAEAYAAVAYLVTTFNNKRSSTIVMARSKVTPLRYKSKTKVTEIPRLELYSALCAARLTYLITNSLPKLNVKRFMWSDSEVVLRWLKNPNMKLKAYAVSPIVEILNKTDKNEWNYVPSKLNVADIATKFKKFDFSDSTSAWFKGPDFITLDKSHWPKTPELLPIKDDSIAEQGICINNVNYELETVEFKSHIKLPDINDPIANESCIDLLPASIRSTWIKLVRATARGLKLYMDGFIPLIMSKKYNDVKKQAEIKAIDFDILTPNDLDRAELFLIRRAQRKSWPEEYAALQNGKPFENMDMQQLRVFLDDQGVIRIRSRVKLGPNVYPQQFSPFLSRENPYTKIFLLHVHCEYNHIHLETQVAAARSKYWIPSVRVALKSIQNQCNLCRYRRSQPYAPIMAPLPTCRIDPNQFPFQTTGLDCAGPITIELRGGSKAKDNQKNTSKGKEVTEKKHKKIWIIIFTCTLTRFIQLHILESLSSIAVLEAIAVLWSTNGPVQTFLSDNGTNFKGASRFIRQEWERDKNTLKEIHSEIATQLAEKYRVDWKFFPAHSPWMGGFYERPIKEVKRSLMQILENKKLSMIELNIALQDTCHRLNCRPLTHNPLSADDDEVLTPHHLARGRAGWPYLPSYTPVVKEPKEDRRVFRRSRALADQIMSKFVTGYLPILTKTTKWFKEISTPLRIGDIVLLIEPNQTRREWQRARVIKIYKSSDKRGRVADVQLQKGKIKKARSIQRLAKLEFTTRNDSV